MGLSCGQSYHCLREKPTNLISLKLMEAFLFVTHKWSFIPSPNSILLLEIAQTQPAVAFERWKCHFCMAFILYSRTFYHPFLGGTVPSIMTPLWFSEWVLLIRSTRIDYADEGSVSYKWLTDLQWPQNRKGEKWCSPVTCISKELPSSNWIAVTRTMLYQLLKNRQHIKNWAKVDITKYE